MIPGRILIVDDKKGEVDELIGELFRRGEHVIYSGAIVDSEYYHNVRLLILDYWLDEDSEQNSLESMTTIISDIAKNSKFFMIAIWSLKVTEENKQEYQKNIHDIYKKRFEAEIPGILLEPMNKEELKYKTLLEKIEREIAMFPELNMSYEIEKIFDNAKDKVKTTIYDIGNWSNLVKSLEQEYDPESIERQLLYIYSNIMKRYLNPSEKFLTCIKQVSKMTAPFNIDDYGRVYSAQYYYPLSDSEQISTGDIIKNEESGKYFIIMNPECDITNDKHTATTLVEGVGINHSDLTDPDNLGRIASYCEKDEKEVFAALINGSGLRENYCNLAFLWDSEMKQFFYLIFDFNKVTSLKKIKKMSELNKYRRICRVDSPMINSLIQKYVSHCSRHGTLTIPSSIRKQLKKKYQENVKELVST